MPSHVAGVCGSIRFVCFLHTPHSRPHTPALFTQGRRMDADRYFVISAMAVGTDIEFRAYCAQDCTALKRDVHATEVGPGNSPHLVSVHNPLIRPLACASLTPGNNTPAFTALWRHARLGPLHGLRGWMWGKPRT